MLTLSTIVLSGVARTCIGARSRQVEPPSPTMPSSRSSPSASTTSSGVRAAVEPLSHVVLADGVLLAEEFDQLRGDRVEPEQARRRHVEQQPPAVHVDLVQVGLP